jgi:hypothetical protein
MRRIPYSTLARHGSNRLAGLPDAIGHLSRLKELYLSRNQLTARPESIVALTNLTAQDNPTCFFYNVMVSRVTTTHTRVRGLDIIVY